MDRFEGFPFFFFFLRVWEISDAKATKIRVPLCPYTLLFIQLLGKFTAFTNFGRCDELLSESSVLESVLEDAMNISYPQVQEAYKIQENP